MNCQEARPKLVDYLANELSPSQRRLMVDHLAACAACQAELSEITALQRRINQSLRRQASGVIPSEQALSRLQSRLAFEAPRQPLTGRAQGLAAVTQTFTKGIQLMKQPIFAITLVLALLVGALSFVPAVRAQVQGALEGWFGFQVPNSSDFIAIQTVWDFQPLNPRYLPDHLKLKASMWGGDPTTTQLGLSYQPEDAEVSTPFVVIMETKVDGPVSLPEGKALTLRGHPASLEMLGPGAIEWHRDPNGQPMRYEKALRLTWVENDVKIEITGTYSESQLVRVASSLTEAPVSPDGKP